MSTSTPARSPRDRASESLHQEGLIGHDCLVPELLETFAFGVALHLTTAAEGGRQSPLAGGSGPEARFAYRPNWGLPGMTPPDQSGAPVLAFSREHVAPGDEVRVVVVPPFPGMIPEWERVQVGDVLPMYEGPHVCGHGRIIWRRATVLPLPPGDENSFRNWVVGPEGASEPDTHA